MKIKRPLIIPAIAVAVISLTAVFVDTVLAIIISATFAVAAGILGCFKKKEYFVSAVIFLFVLIMLIGNFTVMNKSYGGADVEICGEVTEIDTSDFGVNYVVRVTKGELYGSKVSLRSADACFGIGDTVNVTAKLFIDDYSANRAEKIFYTGKIVSLNSVGSSRLGSLLEKLRNKIAEKLFLNMSYPSAATFCALLFGNKEYLSEEFLLSVKNAGLSHVLVVSGMHMAIIVGGFYSAMQKSKLSKSAITFISLLFTLFFMAICGFTPSVMRAGITYFIMILSSVFLRKSDAVSSLCAACIIMAVINPFIFGSVSFLLSVSATAGVLVLYPWLSEKCNCKNKYLSLLKDAVLMSVSAVICTAPVTLIFFGTVNVMAVVTSVLVSVAVSTALVVGLVSVTVSFVPFAGEIARFPLFITDVLMRYFNFLVKIFG